MVEVVVVEDVGDRADLHDGPGKGQIFIQYPQDFILFFYISFAFIFIFHES